ncbi:hypothetical protein E4T39_05058 [Aureobasidium subglaciale]|nr:hypothetical protein E4T39_05058 [Aureobasidium subglaciale]
MDLQVSKLLQLNAGVDLSIERIHLLIQDFDAKVLLEARLENLVQMVDDVLRSLDLNPVIATLDPGIGNIVNKPGDTVYGLLSNNGSGPRSNSNAKRSFMIDDKILFSANDFSGNSHTNRILEQHGDIIEQDLENNGHVSSSRVVGSCAKDLKFTGHDDIVPRGVEEVIVAIFFGATGEVAGTQIFSQLEV